MLTMRYTARRMWTVDSDNKKKLALVDKENIDLLDKINIFLVDKSDKGEV